MQKTTNLKTRLIAAVLVLVMLVTSLIGTTFAWFTDAVTSSGNKIISGSLKVDLELLDQKTGNWKSLKESKAPIFTYNNWEPGYVDAKVLRVENEGTLALKWKAQFVSEEELSELANVIDVYVKAYGVLKDDTTVSYPADRTLDGYTKVGTVAEFVNTIEQTTYGNLLAGEVAYLGIALKMQEAAGNEYQEKKLGEFDIRIVATQMAYEGDSFGNDYDDKAEFPEMTDFDVVVDVPVANGVTTAETTVAGEGFSVTVPAGAKVEGNKLGVSVTEKASSDTNLTLNDNEIMRPLDVHVEGLAEGNTAPIVINLGEVMPKGLNIGNYTLYHVENGQNVAMTATSAVAELDTHNEFYYDPATGEVTVAMATFSEVAMVAEPAKWEGNRDYSWYTNAVAPVDGESTPDYVIANADQLAAFGAIVGGMDGQTQDSFSGKTVKLIADINIGDLDSENGIVFYPIGYYNSEGTYEKTNTAITSGLRNFEGTFDGNGNTISNFYQNTWEMKGDHNWYDATLQYYRDGMGLFGKVYGGTVKNLTVENFSSDGEITTTGTIAAYAEGATFENIAIFNCNPRVYNIGNGGIVGCVGWYAKKADLKTTFKNITVDNSNKISALWGTYDAACGGIVGQYYPTSGQTSAGTPKNAGIDFVNCHVSAQMDVYNDVCANYQYYAYRYTGMLIGSVRENVTVDGHVYPKMDGITASGCTVHFGTWNDYYYCEIIDNTTASYTHDYQMSRLTEIKAIDGTTITYLDGTTGTVPASGRANYVIVDYTKGHGTENATCYHFKDGAVWTHDMGGIQTGIDENGDGQDDLKEDKQHIYLEFNNLVTGYGWGVTSKGVGDLDGVTILDREVADSVNKFAPVDNVKTEFASGSNVTIGELFAAINGLDIAIKSDNVQVAVSPFGANSTAGGTYVADTTDWTKGTLTFSGTGVAVITITDYYFCKTTTITVNIIGAEKFDTKFVNYKDYLYRVGNASGSTVALGTIFKANDGVEIDSSTVKVTFETVGGNASGTCTANTSDWTKGTIQFTGTGVVKVIIGADEAKSFELTLEVVDAVNATTATNATANNVVLLNDIGSGFTISGRYTVFGNGFTLTYTDNGQYLNNGLKQGIITVSENGTLDNLRIKATIYPKAYMYYSSASLGSAVTSGPSSVEGDKTRYHYQLSAVAASGNATISNCYIYGGRNNVFVNTGDVTIKDTVMECGVVANVQIQSNASHTITLENVTTIQYLVDSNVADTTSVKMLGAGIIVGPETNDNPKIVLNGEFKQYNWVTADDKAAVSDEAAKEIINGALNATAYNHTVNGKIASNLGIIYMNTNEANIENNTGLPYTKGTVEISGVSGAVYSLQNATADQIYSDYANADKSTVNGLYQPQFKYDDDLGGQYVAEGGDEHCFREGDTIKVLFPSGDTKELDLTALVNIAKYSGQDLGLVITVKDSSGNDVTVTNGKITLSAIEEYTVTYTVTDTLFYGKDGEPVTKSIEYSWNVTISVSLKDTAVPNAYFEYDTTKQTMGYAKKSVLAGGQTQYLPFLAGLKIYDYNGQTAYLRFDGDNDFNKIASATITGYTSANHVLIEVKLTDGGVINVDTTARAVSGGSTYTGTLNTSGNTLYYVNDGTTSATTTTWVISSYKFTGNNGVEIDSGAVTFSNCTNGSVPTGSFSTTIKYTVTYDANGGNCGQTTGYATSASAAVTLPTPTRSGYIFAGWYTAASGGTRVGGAGESYTPSSNITLYAQWGQPYTVTYNANGGRCGTESEKYSGTALTLPTPTRDGYWFIGWYDAASGGKKIGDAGATYNPSGEITLYAHWQEAIEYTVTYNANGGTCGTASATYQGTALILPTPTRTGYTFNGWYTAATGGTKVGDAGASYAPTANITLYAQWAKNYTITVTASNAAVKVNGTAVNNNGTVSIPEGTSVNVEVDYTYSNGESTTITGTDGTPYTSPFNMPAQNVTINSSSDEGCVTPDTLVTLADGTQKEIQYVTYEDQLLVWDFVKGEYTVMPAIVVRNHGYGDYRVLTLHFSDGTSINVIAEHGFFDVGLNEFVMISEDNIANYVGHEFVKADGEFTTVTLESYSVKEEYTAAYSILTAVHYNCVLGDMLTLTPNVIGGNYFMPFEIGEDMKFDAEKMQADIETYGLFTYEEFADLVTEEQFYALNAPYVKVAVGKGIITMEELYQIIEELVPQTA